jgi:hypothetical protein
MKGKMGEIFFHVIRLKQVRLTVSHISFETSYPAKIGPFCAQRVVPETDHIFRLLKGLLP